MRFAGSSPERMLEWLALSESASKSGRRETRELNFNLRDSEMDAAVNRRIAPILESSFAPSVACFNADGFHYCLTRELAESKRYGQFSGFLLFRVGDKAPTEKAHRLVRCLSTHLRDTDFIGLLDERTIGVILQHATVENTELVLNRLRAELCSLLGRPTQVNVSSAVFPTEANTLESLCSLAEHRLAQTAS